jgi:hypothetical protein
MNGRLTLGVRFELLFLGKVLQSMVIAMTVFRLPVVLGSQMKTGESRLD